ncbi:MAG: nickel-type superoxide dismutase maturation protease [Oleiphilaceae bacterium]|jgi:nickel-type superoxide dismutase maturation protease
MLSLRKIEGASMYPVMVEGDYIVINHLFWQLNAGDIIVVNHPIYKNIIKRIVAIATNGDLWLRGENIDSVTPEKMGWVKEHWVKGKVIYTIKS